MRIENLYCGKNKKALVGGLELDKVRAHHRHNKREGKQRYSVLEIRLPETNELVGWIDASIIYLYSKEAPNDLERIVDAIRAQIVDNRHCSGGPEAE